MKTPAPVTWQTMLTVASLLISTFFAVMTMNRADESTATELEARLTLLEAENGALRAIVEAHNQLAERKFSGRHGFMTSAKEPLDFLCNKDLECRSRFGPVQMVE